MSLTINSDDRLLTVGSTLSTIMDEDPVIEKKYPWYYRFDMFRERVSLRISRTDKRYVQEKQTLCASITFIVLTSILAGLVLRPVGDIIDIHILRQDFNLTNYWDYGDSYSDLIGTPVDSIQNMKNNICIV